MQQGVIFTRSYTTSVLLTDHFDVVSYSGDIQITPKDPFSVKV